MRLISIEPREGPEAVVINPDNICSIYSDKGIVNVRMTCGWNLLTKFTDVDHATDYIQRAANMSLSE